MGVIINAGDLMTQAFEERTVTGVSGRVLTFSGAAFTGPVEVAYNFIGPTSLTADELARRQPLRLQWMLGSPSQASTTWSGISTPKWTSNHRLRGCSHVRALMLVDNKVYAQGLPNRHVCETLFRHVWNGGADAADATRLAAVTAQLQPARDAGCEPGLHGWADGSQR